MKQKIVTGKTKQPPISIVNSSKTERNCNANNSNDKSGMHLVTCNHNMHVLRCVASLHNCLHRFGFHSSKKDFRRRVFFFFFSSAVVDVVYLSITITHSTLLFHSSPQFLCIFYCMVFLFGMLKTTNFIEKDLCETEWETKVTEYQQRLKKKKKNGLKTVWRAIDYLLVGFLEFLNIPWKCLFSN